MGAASAPCNGAPPLAAIYGPSRCDRPSRVRARQDFPYLKKCFPSRPHPPVPCTGRPRGERPKCDRAVQVSRALSRSGTREPASVTSISLPSPGVSPPREGQTWRRVEPNASAHPITSGACHGTPRDPNASFLAATSTSLRTRRNSHRFATRAHSYPRIPTRPVRTPRAYRNR
jgi:hypothetical protein